MKQRIPALILFFLCTLLLSGCLVTSLEPWFAPTQFVSDDRLLGVWTAENGDAKEQRYTITRAEKEYRIEAVEKGKTKKSFYTAVLGRTANQFFLDVQPVLPKGLGDEGILLYPTHTIIRLEFGPDILVMRLLKTDAVEQAVRLGHLRTVDPARPSGVLINTTRELQRFLAIHAANLNLWDSPARLTRVAPPPPASPSPPPPRP